jgi:hypothetical protein
MQATSFSSLFVATCLAFGVVGCDTISVHTHAYLGSPQIPPTNPAAIEILSAKPTRPNQRLGEIVLGIEGNPPRSEIEEKLRRAAAKLGADAVYVTFDRMHAFPVVYGGGWGPVGMAEEMRRDIVAVAIKNQ